MKAMILAAGSGERMRPLTDTTPKPLLEVQGKPLILYQLEALKQAGITDVIINTGALGEQIHTFLRDGRELGVRIKYSDEGNEPLETAGGIINVLPFFEGNAFIVANADIYSEFDYRSLPAKLEGDAHLVLVKNPAHHLAGDFSLTDGYITTAGGSSKFTYSGMGIYHPRLFEVYTPGHRPLAPILFTAADKKRLTGQIFGGYWNDIGTPERLSEVNCCQGV